MSDLVCGCFCIYPLVTNGLSHAYHLDESNTILGTHLYIFIQEDFFFCISFSDENHVSKQHSPNRTPRFANLRKQMFGNEVEQVPFAFKDVIYMYACFYMYLYHAVFLVDCRWFCNIHVCTVLYVSFIMLNVLVDCRWFCFC